MTKNSSDTGALSPVHGTPDASRAGRFGWRALKLRLASAIGRGFDRSFDREPEVGGHRRAEAALIQSSALQNAIFNSANFSSIATDAQGVIQIFNVGAERMLGYSASEVVNQITPAGISDAQEIVARAITSCGSEMSAGVILLTTSAAA